MFPFIAPPPSLKFHVSIVTSFPRVTLRGSQSKSTPRSSNIPVGFTPRCPPTPTNARPFPSYVQLFLSYVGLTPEHYDIKLRVHPFTLTRQYSDHARPLCRQVVASLDKIMRYTVYTEALASATPLPSLLATGNLFSMQH